MKGHVPTPPELAMDMVETVFDRSTPSPTDRILFPGVGTGPFVKAVREYCLTHDLDIPNGVGIDTNPEHIDHSRDAFAETPVEFRCHDFLDLDTDLGEFNYVIGNPPYVPIENLSTDEKIRYKRDFTCATGRFDLYLLFFERSLDLLSDGGHLIFVTPEKFEYVDAAANLRKKLTSNHLIQIQHIDQDVFSGRTTYPTVSLIQKSTPDTTEVINRKGETSEISLPMNGERWTSVIRQVESAVEPTGVTLGDITVRISPGMATGRDSIFVLDEDDAADFPNSFQQYLRPTVSGRQLEQIELNEAVVPSSYLLCPYDEAGELLPLDEAEDGTGMAQVRDYLEMHQEELRSRSCVKNGDSWFEWHENPPMNDLLNEKILFRDITASPAFWDDPDGDIIPRHSVYYILPKDPDQIPQLLEYLNRPEVENWLRGNCQRARNGYLRLQSRVMGELPVPPEFVDRKQARITE